MSDAADLSGFPKQRVETLADGICAIVMTLLVLELLGGPLASAHDGAAVSDALAALWPKVASYLISFVIVGVLWVAHHAQFHWVRRTDRRHIWLNLLFLLTLSLIPFSAALLGEHPGLRVSVLLYGANVVLAGGALLGQWHYAARHGLLVTDRPAGVDRAVYRRMLWGQVAYGAALVVAVAAPRVAFWLYVLYAAGYVAVQLAPDDRARG